ncbi:spermidine/putrescine transport system permease protein [Paenibacillus forsythiae]|uniref:Spermidine/putrescine transport system permease protein n=1 Tax=Paenibacillus forsythiae TaxID=365616 RepID=A0ABU3HD18_9BACL|nr:ABC transporter permease [Paenibacillus forsythiae]MDT3427937.1 spermidine/putrescine transport system permease protein [Paenibacillus forsythiae]
MYGKNLMLIMISVWVLLFIVLPVSAMLLFSFWSIDNFRIIHSFSIQNYSKIFQDPIYLSLLWKTIKLALIVAVLSALISYPLALFVNHRRGTLKTILFLGVLAPLWVGYLVRIYSWRSILGESGFINSLLVLTGILKQPSSSLLFNSSAVVITMLCISIPFTFIPIYSAIEKIPGNLLQAAADLGASGSRTFWTVVFPLSMPGVVTGFMFAFITSFGDYMTPSLVGGTSGIMYGNMIQTQFGNSYNWPLGAALSMIMLLFILAVIAATRKIGNVQAIFEE